MKKKVDSNNIFRDMTSKMKNAFLDNLSKKLIEVNHIAASSFFIPDEEEKIMDEFLSKFVIMP